MDRLVGKKGQSGAVVFWQAAMLISPIVVGVATPVAGWLLSAFADRHQHVALSNFFDAIKFVGTMCFPFGAYFAARGRSYAAQVRASAAWPTVPGKVGSSRIERAHAYRGITYYSLEIAYRYAVDGRTYDGDTVQFGPLRMTDRALIEKLADKYPVGQDVVVHYNPYAPADAVLEVADEMAGQDAWKIWLFLGMPIVLGIAAAIKNS